LATTSATVTSIAHEYTSLAAALPQAAATGAKDASHLNTSDLVAGNYVLNIACYYDSGPDTATVIIDAWTEDATHYLRVYTPSNTATECNQSQRHAGKWDSTKYNMVFSSGWQYVNYGIGLDRPIRFEGIQFAVNPDANDRGIINVYWQDGDTNYTFNSCIFKSLDTAGTYYAKGIKEGTHGGSAMIFYIYNSVFYDFVNPTWGTAIETNAGNVDTFYIYNCTFNNNGTAISEAAGTFIMKNSLFTGNSADVAGTATTFAAGTDYNATNRSSIGYTVTGSGNTHDRPNQTFSFVNAGAKDFHLAYNDTGARDHGTDLSADANLAFSTDIDGQSRPYGVAWDIGADEESHFKTQINTPDKLAGPQGGLVGNWTFDGPDIALTTSVSSYSTITYVNGATNYSTASYSTATTTAFNTSAGNLIVVGIWPNCAVSVTSVDDTASPSNTYYSAGTDATYGLAIWYAYNTTAKTGNVVTAHLSGSCNYREIIALQYSGADTTSAVFDSAYTPSANTDGTSPFTTTAANTAVDSEIVIGLFADIVAGETYSSSAPSTFRLAPLGGGSYDTAMADNLTTTAGSYNVGVAGTVNENNRCFARAFKAAAATLSTSITALDRSGQNNNGTIYNATTTYAAPGVSGQALKFDGVNDYVSVANESNFDFMTDSTKAFSASFWIYTNANANGTDIISKLGTLDASNGGLQISYGNNWTSGALQNIAFFMSTNINDVFYAVTATSSVPLNKWTHGVVVYNGNGYTAGNATIYINGGVASLAESNKAGTPVTINNSTNLRMGADASAGTGYYSGLIDEVRVYNRALSADEISQLYQIGASRLKINMPSALAPPTDSGLVGYWSFNGPDMNWSTNTAYDRSGSGNNGTMISMSTTTSPVAGVSGQALNFASTTSNYVTMGDVLDFALTDQFTVSAWIKPARLPAAGADFGIVGKELGSSPFSGWYFGLYDVSGNGTKLTMGYIDGSGSLTYSDTSSYVVTAGNWQHVVGVYNNENITIYINGSSQAVTSGTAAAGSVNTAAPLLIGSESGSGDLFNGLIDEVRIYNYALSTSTIQQLGAKKGLLKKGEWGVWEKVQVTV